MKNISKTILIAELVAVATLLVGGWALARPAENTDTPPDGRAAAGVAELERTTASHVAMSPDLRPTTDLVALDPNAESGDIEAMGTASPHTIVTLSFTNSCRPPFASQNNPKLNAIVSASAGGGCRRFDGSYTGPASWTGVCRTNVSNCNGAIVCQSHCP